MTDPRGSSLSPSGTRRRASEDMFSLLRGGRPRRRSNFERTVAGMIAQGRSFSTVLSASAPAPRLPRHPFTSPVGRPQRSGGGGNLPSTEARLLAARHGDRSQSERKLPRPVSLRRGRPPLAQRLLKALPSIAMSRVHHGQQNAYRCHPTRRKPGSWWCAAPQVEEFDFESANRKQLRGNIYLAKVTRVEPSLQAAFVEYGGNRHGFLAFSEIHPDYYQIPVADRQALIEDGGARRARRRNARTSAGAAAAAAARRSAGRRRRGQGLGRRRRGGRRGRRRRRRRRVEPRRPAAGQALAGRRCHRRLEAPAAPEPASVAEAASEDDAAERSAAAAEAEAVVAEAAEAAAPAESAEETEEPDEDGDEDGDDDETSVEARQDADEDGEPGRARDRRAARRRRPRGGAGAPARARAASTRSRKSSSAARSCSCRSSRRSAATRARR